jgi:hypothetical protein
MDQLHLPPHRLPIALAPGHLGLIVVHAPRGAVPRVEVPHRPQHPYVGASPQSPNTPGRDGTSHPKHGIRAMHRQCLP